MNEEGTSTAWLIENGRTEGDLRYQVYRNGVFTWTPLASEALQFCRRIDAETIAAASGEFWRVVEHGFAPTVEDDPAADSAKLEKAPAGDAMRKE